MAILDKLYNYDEKRTEKVTEVRVAGMDACVALKYIPVDQSVTVTGLIPSSTKDVRSNEFYINYAPDSEYYAAEGVVQFHTNLINQPVTITYVPLASRIDAADMNTIVANVSDLNDTAVRRAELSNPTSGVTVSWGNISGKPSVATETSDGFLSYGDKTKLNTVDDKKKPIGSVVVAGTAFEPDDWGGPVEVLESSTIKPSLTANGLVLSISKQVLDSLVVNQNHRDAMTGTYGVPSLTNKYVTENDPKYKDQTTILVHAHTVSDITGLDDALAAKAEATHAHIATDITDLGPLLDAKAATVHDHTIDNVTGLKASLDTLSSQTGTNTSSIDELQKKVDNVGGSHNHTTAQIEGLREFVENVAQGNPDSGSNIDINTDIAPLTSLAGLVNDFNVSGFVTTVSGKNVTISAGSQYAGGILVPLSSNKIIPLTQPNSPVKVTGDSNVPVWKIFGTYTDTTIRSYTITISVANKNAGMHLGMEATVVDSTGVKSFTQKWENGFYSKDSETYIALGDGLSLFVPVPSGYTYTVGTSYKVTIDESGVLYIVADSRLGGIAAVRGNNSLLSEKGVSPVASISGTAVTDLRPKPANVLKDLTAITKPTKTADNSIATTSFVSQELAALSQLLVTRLDANDTKIKDLETRLTAAEKEIATLKGGA